MTVQTFLTILGPVGSLLGAWIGVRLALSTHRGQRAFDARLEWFRIAIRRLRSRENAFADVVGQSNGRVNETIAKEAFALLTSNVSEDNVLLDDCEIFLSHSTFVFMAKCFKAASDLHPPDSLSTHETMRRLSQIGHLYGLVAIRLAADIRSDLGLGRLSLKDVPNKEKYDGVAALAGVRMPLAV
jgi:hypothetical protein